MADPFSIIAGIVGVVDVAVKVVKFINKTKKGADTVDGDLRELVTEIESLENTSAVVRNAFERDLEDGNTKRDGPTARTWSAVSTALMDCNAALTDMHTALAKMKGDDGSSTVDRLKRHFRKLAQDEEFMQLHRKLDKGHHRLQTALLALGIITTRQSHAGLSAQMVTQEQLIRSLGSHAQPNLPPPYEANVHFMTPQPVSNLFMGRKREFLQLRQALEERYQAQNTTRVVIYGINGSGKTQFCCKFAQDNRIRFWGVFFVDATNAETVRSSYADIAERVGIAPKESNVKHWLSEQTKPWLLLIDNANDDQEGLGPEKHIPESPCGVILFTTTNHSLKALGHLAIKFDGIEEKMSDVLLLTSAERPQPATLITVQTANDICRTFGFLPLAILHAGTAISNGTCTLQNCLEKFERSLAKVKDVLGNKAKATSTTASERVYATFGLVIPVASEEALQVLQLLSFMQSQRFHFQILLRAILNPQRQASADRSLKKTGPAFRFQIPSWSRMSRDIVRAIYGFFQRQGDLPALPHILRSLQNEDAEKAEDRLREVFVELRKLALIDHNEEDDTYGMHSSVTWWIRASMSFREKQVWCQAAYNVLASAILLPPVGVEDDDSQLRRQSLPHIQHAREQEEQLRAELKRRQRERDRSWPDVSPTLDRARLLRDAKFSLAYAESGMFHESQQLMLVIDGYLVNAIGLQDPVSVRVRLFLAETYWWLGNPEEAGRLQKELLDACVDGLGEEHVDTLRASEKLGASYWQMGKYHEGRRFAEKAVNGYRKMYLSGHVEKSQALTNLGRCFGKLADFDQAVELHEEALRGLQVAEQEAETQYSGQILDVKENLAMARYDRHRYKDTHKDDLLEAERLQDEVLRDHEEKLGREHPKSLWATCNLARIKASAGAVEEAEHMIETGLPVAERTIGANHIGTLMGKTYLGQILTMAGKLIEAESLLSTVVNMHQDRDGDQMHGDHLVAASFLLDCYRRRNKHQEAERMEEKVLAGIRRIFGEESPWEHYFVGRYMVSTGAEIPEGW